ncbi:unnamed protein product [Paramecium octaurelia]|uniref:Uncharacterized protein n=1 Tax=Paramecium octaurelia TaxID=43137 RepID=A0A8S1UTB2_PAROT|nr:unnamed protein product [Paramecium octaurelia]
MAPLNYTEVVEIVVLNIIANMKILNTLNSFNFKKEVYDHFGIQNYKIFKLNQVQMKQGRIIQNESK